MNGIGVVGRLARSGRYAVCGLALLPAAMSGCAPAQRTVEGTVTVDGQPLADGAIAFDPVHTGKVASAVIVDGKFSARVEAGERRVSVQGFRPSKMPGPDGKPFKEQYLPASLNTASTQRVSIPSGGLPDLRLDLKTK